MNSGSHWTPELRDLSGSPSRIAAAIVLLPIKNRLNLLVYVLTFTPNKNR